MAFSFEIALLHVNVMRVLRLYLLFILVFTIEQITNYLIPDNELGSWRNLLRH